MNIPIKQVCEEDRHEYSCMIRQGALGEINIFTKHISVQDVKLSIDNATYEQEVCPGGIIVCRRCLQPLLSKHHSQNVLNVDELTRKINKAK